MNAPVSEPFYETMTRDTRAWQGGYKKWRLLRRAAIFSLLGTSATTVLSRAG